MLWRSGSPEAPIWAQKAFELAERLGDFKVLAECYNDLGTLNLKSGEFEKASKNYERGLKIVSKTIIYTAVRLYNNLSNLYWSMGEFQKVFETAQKGSELARKVGDLEHLLGLILFWRGVMRTWGRCKEPFLWPRTF